ncbi:winged helix-turn-helix transcriptional regulator [Allorhizocola rhizosphaerae]|uniref:winged helix-turn-helix transcriptional regulator n=1 Tax=Allorhizocola rhizosphaerae TaxID=1872709 RepID=UPI000E3EB199|nr:response regulator transcription factor [Allorhizocola rhizosphaerae]
MTTMPQPAAVRRGPGLRFVLVIADSDPVIAGELATELTRHHIEVHVCTTAAEALLAAGSLKPDTVLAAAAAAQAGGISSTEIVSVLARASVPVVVGISTADGIDAAAVLDGGARACVARPYRVNELIPILRAIRPDRLGGDLDPVIECGALTLDPATMEVRLHGRLITLPLREYLVLRFLMNNADRVVTREQIYQHIWGGVAEAGSNTLTVHIKRLRKRLGDDLKKPHIIITVRHIGYRLVPPIAR